MTIGLALAGCWAGEACLAASPGEDAIAALDADPAEFTYSVETGSAIGLSNGAWFSPIDSLSPYRLYPSVLDVSWLHDRRLADSGRMAESGLQLGYAWRNMKLEGALMRMRDEDRRAVNAGVPRLLGATSGRLSYRFAPYWTLQVVKGSLSQHDASYAGSNIQRTSIAVRHSRPFHGNDWQTMLAVGRNVRKSDGSADKVYLVESSLRFSNRHAVFARFERASANELFDERDALYGQNFHSNRMTLGYVHAIQIGARSQLAFGGLVAKRSVPRDAVVAFGDDRPSYKVFAQVSLHMP
ncbi:MAG TPA: hypothetical protein VEC06_03150 [Paucimonas sp.]|nr:hypothetical protein [Paucimonas sp.]